jgi:hypothetical protein
MNPDQSGLPEFGNPYPYKIIPPFDIGRTGWGNPGNGHIGFILFAAKMFPLYGKEFSHHAYPGVKGVDLGDFLFTGQ